MALLDIQGAQTGTGLDLGFPELEAAAVSLFYGGIDGGGLAPNATPGPDRVQVNEPVNESITLLQSHSIKIEKHLYKHLCLSWKPKTFRDRQELYELFDGDRKASSVVPGYSRGGVEPSRGTNAYKRKQWIEKGGGDMIGTHGGAFSFPGTPMLLYNLATTNAVITQVGQSGMDKGDLLGSDGESHVFRLAREIEESLSFKGVCITPESTTRGRSNRWNFLDVRTIKVLGETDTYNIWDWVPERGPLDDHRPVQQGDSLYLQLQWVRLTDKEPQKELRFYLAEGSGVIKRTVTAPGYFRIVPVHTHDQRVPPYQVPSQNAFGLFYWLVGRVREPPLYFQYDPSAIANNHARACDANPLWNAVDSVMIPQLKLFTNSAPGRMHLEAALGEAGGKLLVLNGMVTPPARAEAEDEESSTPTSFVPGRFVQGAVDASGRALRTAVDITAEALTAVTGLPGATANAPDQPRKEQVTFTAGQRIVKNTPREEAELDLERKKVIFENATAAVTQAEYEQMNFNKESSRMANDGQLDPAELAKRVEVYNKLTEKTDQARKTKLAARVELEVALASMKKTHTSGDLSRYASFLATTDQVETSGHDLENRGGGGGINTLESATATVVPRMTARSGKRAAPVT